MPRHPLDILIVTGTAISAAAFMFCVIASTAYDWHAAVTGPGIVVSVIAMITCILASHLLGDDQDGDQ